MPHGHAISILDKPIAVATTTGSHNSVAKYCFSSVATTASVAPSCMSASREILLPNQLDVASEGERRYWVRGTACCVPNRLDTASVDQRILGTSFVALERAL